MDGAKEQCIGIYSIRGSRNHIALGGLENTSYSTKAISILIHWGKNANIAEQKAQEVFNALLGQDAVIGGKRVIDFKMITTEPIGVGTDKNNIYQYVIEVNIIHER
ncbi:MAG: minor capsid protein [Clostridium perfringens]|nr:minor capsid protein [Clostridium perfringens]